MAGRDALSILYDRDVDRILRAAILQLRAHTRNSRLPATVATHVFSPRPERDRLDSGGLTRHEREFQRAMYYRVFRVPRNLGQTPDYSLTMEWGPLERGGRRVRVRLYPYRAGYDFAAKHRRPYTEPRNLRRA